MLTRRELLEAAAAGAASGGVATAAAHRAVAHAAGGFRFLRGIAPYSSGAAAEAGHEIVHATLAPAPPYERGFEIVDRHLRAAGRPAAALCGIELRSPLPFTFQGFVDFNRGYLARLRERGLLLGDVNPVARTNVAPEVGPPVEVSLHGFSYTVPSSGRGVTFVVAGAGELAGERLAAEEIVRRGDLSPAGLEAKARHVLELMDARLAGLGASWAEVTAVNVYTVHDIFPLVRALIVPRLGPAASHGIRWYFARPPIEEIEFEMDVRGVRQDLVLSG